MDAQQYECTAYDKRLSDQVYTYASGVVPLRDEPLLTWSGTNPKSIFILTERSHTLAFVGTENGTLFKVCTQDTHTHLQTHTSALTHAQSTWGPLHKTFTGEKTLVKYKNSGKHKCTIDITIGSKLRLK